MRASQIALPRVITGSARELGSIRRRCTDRHTGEHRRLEASRASARGRALYGGWRACKCLLIQVGATPIVVTATLPRVRPAPVPDACTLPRASRAIVAVARDAGCTRLLPRLAAPAVPAC